MSEANKKSEAPSDDPLEVSLGINNTMIRAIEDIETCFGSQIVGNADQVSHDYGELSGNLKSDVDALIKRPLTRQIGRLRGIRRSLEEVGRQLRKMRGKNNGRVANDDP